MIAIIDYGMGNLRSVQKGFEKVGFPAFITSNPDEIAAAPGVVLPGVGAFADAMHSLRETGLDQVIRQIAQANKPILGICLGMQLLFSESEENGCHPGLDIFPGRVVKFNLPGGMKVPHMGWNQIQKQGNPAILQHIPSGSYCYFVHSYYVVPEESALTAALTEYGINFTSIVGRDKIWGIQFHPEKSSELGLKILKNFGEMIYHGNNSGN